MNSCILINFDMYQILCLFKLHFQTLNLEKWVLTLSALQITFYMWPEYKQMVPRIYCVFFSKTVAAIKILSEHVLSD